MQTYQMINGLLSYNIPACIDIRSINKIQNIRQKIEDFGRQTLSALTLVFIPYCAEHILGNKHIYIYIFSIISQHWDCVGSWNVSLWETKIHWTHWSCHFKDDIFKCISLNENFGISNNISLKCVPYALIDKMSSLVQIMARCRIGNKPLSEPMMI